MKKETAQEGKRGGQQDPEKEKMRARIKVLEKEVRDLRYLLKDADERLRAAGLSS